MGVNVMRYQKSSIMVSLGLIFLMSTPSNAAEQYSMAVGTLGGTMGRIGAGLSDAFNKDQSISNLSVTPGGGSSNPARVGTGGADFGYSFSNFIDNAIKGKAPNKKAYANLRVVANFYNSCYHQYVAKDVYDAGYKTWEDIVNSKKSLRMALVKKGTSSEAVGALIVKHLGSSYQKMAARGDKQTFAGTSANSRAIRSNQVDFYFHNSGDPNGAGIQAALGRDLTFLKLSKNVKSMMTSEGFTPCVIPGGIYKGNPNDTQSMGIDGMLITTDKMSSDVVYNILKSTFGNLKKLSNVHKIYKKLTPQSAAKVGTLPLHDGAKRFYKEAGVL
jgi:TRAP transporter TAXI family solute receptor